MDKHTTIPLFKCCSKCRNEFPATAEYFNKSSKSSDGLRSECKECRKSGTANYYRKNAERIKKYVNDWIKRNPELRRTYVNTYIDRVRERHNANARRYIARHRERLRERWRRSYARNPLPHRLKARIRQRRIRNAPGSFTKEDVRRIFEEQEHRCAYCGITLFWDEKNGFHVEHHEAIIKGGTNNPDNLRCTCPFCNLSKGSKSFEEWKAVRGW